MRYQILFSAILCLVFSCTQAFDIIAQHTHVVKTCQIQAIIEDVEEFVNNIWNLYDEVYASYKNLMVEAVECTNDSSDIVSCVASAVLNWMTTVSPEMAQYYVNLVAWAEHFVQDVSNCA